jgi:hypothetical protein
MTLSVLPAVAKSFVVFCSKCEGDKFHTVITHLSPDSAKIVCDICKKKSTFKLSAQKTKGSSVSEATQKRLDDRGAGTGRQRSQGKSHSESHSKHEALYSKLLGEVSSQPSVNYSIHQRFSLKQKLQHSKFGLGVVNRVLDDRMEVVFFDEIRLLVHKSL